MITIPHVTSHNAADERQAHQDFRILLQMMDAYALPKTATIDWTTFATSKENVDGPSEQRRQMYASNLIHSEMRILQFFNWATERLLHAESTWPKPRLTLNDDDVVSMQRQVDDLESAYKKENLIFTLCWMEIYFVRNKIISSYSNVLLKITSFLSIHRIGFVIVPFVPDTMVLVCHCRMLTTIHYKNRAIPGSMPFSRTLHQRTMHQSGTLT